MMRRLIVMGMLLLTTGLSIMSLSAQDLCESIVQSALALAESNCAGVTGNTACYANNDITPTFYQSVSAPPFWTPGTIVDVSALHVSVKSGKSLQINTGRIVMRPYENLRESS